MLWADTLSTLKSTQLIAACNSGDAIQAQALITKRADPDSKIRGTSALGTAIARRDVEVVRVLLRAGASANADTSADKSGSSVQPATSGARSVQPLHLAARCGPATLVELLIDASADPRAATSTGLLPSETVGR